MSFQIQRAQRQKAKLRIGLFGPSGSGKTMSALKMAYGLSGSWEKIVVIDTENNSAHLYSHLGPYSVIPLSAPYTPERYIEAIKAAENAGFETIIVDSITHEWAGEGGILELSDALAKDAKSSYTVWSKLTPRHNKFIETILRVNAHVICCGRSKQDYALNQTEKNGKTVFVPEKIGLKAVTREGFDYEMTVAFDLMISHLAVSTKDRTGIFQDKPEHVISEETGQRLKEWNDGGVVDPKAQFLEIIHLLDGYLALGLPSEKTDRVEFIKSAVQRLTGENIGDQSRYEAIIEKLKAITDKQAAYDTAWGAPAEAPEEKEVGPEDLMATGEVTSAANSDHV